MSNDVDQSTAIDLSSLNDFREVFYWDDVLIEK